MTPSSATTAGGPVPALAVVDLAKRFGGIQAVNAVSFDLAQGSVLGVIGPNGSGKTTLINLLTGAYRPDRGSVLLHGVECAGRPAHTIATLRMGRTFQSPHVFASLTVRQNMYVATAHRRSSSGVRALDTEVDNWLAAVGLTALADRVANELSGGQQKLVEFARAMVHRPRVVLMDEPFAGVHPYIKASLHEHIREAADGGQTSFLIVSHEVPDLVELSDQFLCLAGGEVLTSGDPATVCAHPAVIEAYLGTPLEGAA
jgi:branched-chain amino acid transport system ATP-binding protein